MKNKPVTRRRFIKTAAGGLGAPWLFLPGCAADRPAPGASSTKRPNIIVLVTDDQRSDALGCAGNPVIHTPNMDRLAGDGTRFANAFVTTPICAASRASIFTGLYERTHGYTFTKPPLSESHVEMSYPFLLRRAGYRTGFIGKFGVKVPEGMEQKMFNVFRPSNYPYFKKTGAEKRHLTDINTDRAIEFLQAGRDDQPFCLSLSFWAPHADDGNPEQYVWPRSCDALYDGITIPDPMLSDPAFFEAHPEFLKTTFNRVRWAWRFDTPQKYQKMVKGYYRMISGVDMALGRLRQELKRLGLHQNTVIILMGDNGYFLGERGYAGKWTMHDMSIRVPLIIHDPGRPAGEQGEVLEEMALNVDLAPTILDLAGLAVPGAMQGRSLLPLLDDHSADWRSEIFCEHLWDHARIPQTEAIRTERWKYIRYPQHPDYEELYDLVADPIEEKNLAADARYKNVLTGLRGRCDQTIQELDASAAGPTHISNGGG